mgnify:FL=1
MLPVTNVIFETVVYGISVYIGDYGSQVLVIVDFFSFEVGSEETTVSIIVFIKGLCITTKEVRELLTRKLLESLKLSKSSF